MEQTSPIGKAAIAVGGLSTLASKLGVSVPTVHEWKSGKRAVPVLRCVSIVNVSNRAVSLQELRPNDWQKIWPELATAHESTEKTSDTMRDGTVRRSGPDRRGIDVLSGPQAQVAAQEV